MLTKKEYINQIKQTVTFYIGINDEDNFTAISAGNPVDIWHHVDDDSSCHVIAVVPENVDRKERTWIAKRGALLVKQHTRKFVSTKNLPVIWTEIQNIEMMEKAGSVRILDRSKAKIIVVK